MEVAQQLQHKRPLDQSRRDLGVRLAPVDEEFSGVMTRAVLPARGIRDLSNGLSRNRPLLEAGDLVS